MQQLTHAGRAVRMRAPRVAKPISREATEQVFSERPSKATLSENGEQPVPKKKAKSKPSSYSKKSSAKSESKPKDKVKKKTKVKKKKTNAKSKLD